MQWVYGDKTHLNILFHRVPVYEFIVYVPAFHHYQLFLASFFLALFKLSIIMCKKQCIMVLYLQVKGPRKQWKFLHNINWYILRVLWKLQLCCNSCIYNILQNLKNTILSSYKMLSISLWFILWFKRKFLQIVLEKIKVVYTCFFPFDLIFVSWSL